ncbi:MAG: DNA adenine methylase [Pseudomonadota bacterium]
MNNELKPISATLPVAPWLGGKRILAKRIAQRISAIDHVRYVEPFVGMGGVFFRRTAQPKLEVINDANRDVINLFRILQRHYQQLLDVLKWQLYSRADFARLAKLDPEQLTDLERAARFLYMQKAGFGGMGRTFGVDFRASRWSLAKVEPLLEAAHERLDGVLIECLDFGECIERYDSRPGTLFYCDPPYWNHESDYGRGVFGRADFERLRGQLAGLQGRFILSLNDTPEVREMFSEFAIEELEVTYTAGSLKGHGKPTKELLISNE